MDSKRSFFLTILFFISSGMFMAINSLRICVLYIVMENLKNISGDYIKTLAKRARESRVYKPFQSTGLMLAEILDDQKHKAIYMRLCKIYDNQELIRKARDVAERKSIENKGAYFMKMLKEVGKISHPKLVRKIKVKKPANLKLEF